MIYSWGLNVYKELERNTREDVKILKKLAYENNRKLEEELLESLSKTKLILCVHFQKKQAKMAIFIILLI